MPFRGNDLELKWCGSSHSLLCLTSWLSIHQLIPFASQMAAPLSSPLLLSMSRGVDTPCCPCHLEQHPYCSVCLIEFEGKQGVSLRKRHFLTLPYHSSKRSICWENETPPEALLLFASTSSTLACCLTCGPPCLEMMPFSYG